MKKNVMEKMTPREIEVVMMELIAMPMEEWVSHMEKSHSTIAKLVRYLLKRKESSLSYDAVIYLSFLKEKVSREALMSVSC